LFVVFISLSASQIPNGGDYKDAIRENSALRMLDRIDDFLSTHQLQVNLPEELGSTVQRINVPLTDQDTQVVQQGRSKTRIGKRNSFTVHTARVLYVCLRKSYIITCARIHVENV
jgi:hypothetical protein